MAMPGPPESDWILVLTAVDARQAPYCKQEKDARRDVAGPIKLS
jgi:hypothetical protein